MEEFIMSSLMGGLLYDVVKDNFTVYSEKISQHHLLKDLSKRYDSNQDLKITNDLKVIESNILDAYSESMTIDNEEERANTFQQLLLSNTSSVSIKNYIENLNVNDGGTVNFD